MPITPMLHIPGHRSLRTNYMRMMFQKLRRLDISSAPGPRKGICGGMNVSTGTKRYITLISPTRSCSKKDPWNLLRQIGPKNPNCKRWQDAGINKAIESEQGL